MPRISGICEVSLLDINRIDHGAAVTTSRCDADYVVTEYGIAKLKGTNLKDRARQLINIAHPDFREELKEQFKERFNAEF